MGQHVNVSNKTLDNLVSATDIDTGEVVRKIARLVVNRVEEMGLKGKKKADAIVDLFVGACMGAIATFGEFHPLTQHLMTVTVMSVSIRGYDAVKALARDPNPELKKD